MKHVLAFLAHVPTKTHSLCLKLLEEEEENFFLGQINPLVSSDFGKWPWISN